MQSFDLVIRGGTLFDGLGHAGRIVDLATKCGVIAAIGEVEGHGCEEIDARGCIVTPGFVDIHTHFDGQVMWDNRLAPSSNHGVTTVVTGNCGVGFAPCKPDQRDMLASLMEGVEDIPEVVMAEGLPWNWETFPEYLDALAARELDVDVVAQLPHSALRVYVMGERGACQEPPTQEDLARMRALTTEAVRAGALGVSTSRNLMHRTKAGDLAPSLYSEEEELLALAHGLRDAGAGVFQIIPRITGSAEEEFTLMRRLCDASQRPLSCSLLQMPAGEFDEWRESLDALSKATAQGVPIKAQVAPRPVGMLYGLDLSFHPFSLHPSFRPLAGLPLAEKVAVMRDPAVRARLLAEQPESENPTALKAVKASRFAYPMGDPPNYEPDLADRIDRKGASLGLTPEEYAYDLLLERDGKAILYQPGANYRDGNLDAVHEMLVHPDTIVALADGGAHYGMICDASFPTFFLERWTSAKAGDQRIELPAAIAALTSEPADAVGLNDRGRLVVGAKADINVIDLGRIGLRAPMVSHDLPSGGKRLRQEADGYLATIASGVITYCNSEPTGALPGRLVRVTPPVETKAA